MKVLYGFLACLLLSTSACNSDNTSKNDTANAESNETKKEGKNDVDVPSAVATAFEQKYPNADKVKWEMDSSDYKVKFRIDDKKYSAKYNNAGNLLETETRLDIASLPKPVSQSISSKFPGYTIKKIDQSDKAGKVVYEVEIEKDTATWDVHLSGTGEVLKKSQEKKKNKDEEDN
jgi:uncharacterized membrane protein YkoI